MAAAVAILASVTVTAARADNGKTQDGQGKYAQLSATWWQWIWSQPAENVGGTNTNPIIDSTGAYAAAGQANGIGPANKYFFLAGTFGLTGITRDVTVPAGKDLFFPVINTDVDNASDPPTDYTVPELRALAATGIDAITTKWATFDGNAVEVFRVKSPTFSYTPAEPSIYDWFGLVGPQFEGTVSPAVSDGYWAFIPAPSSGSHTLQFAGAGPGFAVGVSYNLTVP